jgi:hypothetical protein
MAASVVVVVVAGFDGGFDGECQRRWHVIARDDADSAGVMPDGGDAGLGQLILQRLGSRLPCEGPRFAKRSLRRVECTIAAGWAARGPVEERGRCHRWEGK